MTLYDALKASKGLPVSDSYAALWAKKAESGIKTLTGRLPLFFRTSESRLRDWVIYGNNSVGKNLLEIPVEGTFYNGVSFIVDKAAGTVTATRESASSSDAIFAIEIPDELKGQNLYFSGCPDEGSADTYNVYALDYDTAVRVPQWNGTTPSVTDYGTSNNEVRFIEGHRSQIRLRIKAGYDAQNVVFQPMLREADTSEAFEPYQIGIGERTKNLFDKANCGLITVDTHGTQRFGSILYDIENGEYTLACDNQSGRALYLQTLTNGIYTNVNVTSQLPYTFTVQDIDALILRSTTNQETDWDTLGVYDIMLVKGSTAPESYIPYGYVLNIGVGFAPIPAEQPVALLDTRKTIYIGESPLTEGQTLSMSEFGDIDTQPYADMFIAAFKGFRYDDQLSSNQPEMLVKYKEY